MPSPTHDSKEISTTIDHSQSLPVEKITTDSAESYNDLPPESYWIPEGDEEDWFGQNAIIQRKASRKLVFSANSNHQTKPFSRRSSLSLNQKTKASFIGLPVAQKSRFPDGNHRQNKTGIVYYFRSRSAPGGKFSMRSTEPASPEVSCLGRIGSKKERTKRTGLWRSLAAVLRTRFKGNTVASKRSARSVEVDARAAKETSKESAGSVEPDTRTPGTPGLAALKRLKSGRR